MVAPLGVGPVRPRGRVSASQRLRTAGPPLRPWKGAGQQLRARTDGEELNRWMGGRTGSSLSRVLANSSSSSDAKPPA
ncbi:unnamed protein product [Urochloa humidicola]